MDSLISVIVPIYKVEKYLDRCINSIVNQTYKNLEIILVDDGSPDNCPTMCDEWSKKDNRIKVIHKINGGLSSARNSGIEQYTGEYLTFIDSDDYIEPNYIEELYSTLNQHNADMSICGLNYFNEDGSVYQDIKSLSKQFYKEDRFSLLLEHNITVVVAWNKLYKRHIFEKLKYPLNKKNEDEFVIYDIIDQCRNGIAITEKKLYNYINRANSIMTSMSTKGIFDAIEAFKSRFTKTNDFKIKENCVYRMFNNYIDKYRKFKKDKETRTEIHNSFKKDYKTYKKFLTKFKHKIKFLIFKFLPCILAR